LQKRKEKAACMGDREEGVRAAAMVDVGLLSFRAIWRVAVAARCRCRR